MKIKLQKKIKTTEGVIIFPVFQDQIKKLKDTYPKDLKKFIKERLKSKDFAGKNSEILKTFFDSRVIPGQVVLVGMGQSGKFSANKSLRLGGKIGKILKCARKKEATIVLLPEMEKHLSELVEGLLMSQYKTDIYKTEDSEEKRSDLQKLNLVVSKKTGKMEAEIDRAVAISEGIELVKDLVNGPPNIVDESRMVQAAKEIARENKYKITVWGDKELRKKKWGGLLAVNQGSDKQARCIILKHNGGKRNEKPIILVGKGMIFDTGGYNLKPTNYIETMHLDMAGAAAVLGTFSVLKKLGVKKNVIGILPVAENMISSRAYRPSDIITMYSGQTVEITNTDAEGRLILADGITHAVEQDPDCIVTIATLTGAVSTAVGHRYSGLISNRNKLRKEMEKAGRQVDDCGWPLPLHSDYKKCMDSKIADLRNCDIGTSRVAGCSKGAAFLERFIDGNDWCHIDIGGTAFTKEPKAYQSKGATGHGMRMMVRFIENRAK